MRLRPLTEAECYARCYGGRREDVSLVEVIPVPAGRGEVLGRRLRELIALRLAERADDTDREAA